MTHTFALGFAAIALVALGFAIFGNGPRWP